MKIIIFLLSVYNQQELQNDVDFVQDKTKQLINQEQKQSFQEKIEEENMKNIDEKKYKQMKTLDDLQIDNEILKKPQEVYHNPKAFNIDQFLEEFSTNDCNRGFQITGEEILDHDCLDRINSEVFDVLGQEKVTNNEIFHHLQDKVYNPLLLDVKNRNDLELILNDVYNSHRVETKIDLSDSSSDYKQFSDFVFSQFIKMVDSNDNINTKKSYITDIIKNIINSFSIYWNTCRKNGSLEKAKIDTKSIVKEILLRYEQNETRNFYYTKQIMENIQVMYSKFIKAHQFLLIVKKEGSVMIGSTIVSRYYFLCKAIKDNKLTEMGMVQELSIMLDVAKSFLITNSLDHPEENSHNQFEKIILKIKNIFLNLDKQFQTNKLQSIKEFTVIMLLKFEHLFYITHYYYSINDFIQNPTIDSLYNIKKLIKIYYEIKNSLIIIPNLCNKTYKYKECVVNKMNEYLKQIINKYSLRRSVSGWYFLNFIKKTFQSFFKDIDEKIWDDFDYFKVFFQQQLFKCLFSYKEQFAIRESQSLLILENMIVNTMQNFLNSSKYKDQIDMSMYDKLDVYIYNFMLDLKADFANQLPLDQDFNKLIHIEQLILKFIEKFELENNDKIDDGFEELIQRIKKTLQLWKTQKIRMFQPDPNIISLPLVGENYFKVKNRDKSMDKSIPYALNKVNQDQYNLTVAKDILKEVQSGKDEQEHNYLDPDFYYKPEQNNGGSNTLLKNKSFDEMVKIKNLYSSPIKVNINDVFKHNMNTQKLDEENALIQQRASQNDNNIDIATSSTQIHEDQQEKQIQKKITEAISINKSMTDELQGNAVEETGDKGKSEQGQSESGLVKNETFDTEDTNTETADDTNTETADDTNTDTADKKNEDTSFKNRKLVEKRSKLQIDNELRKSLIQKPTLQSAEQSPYNIDSGILGGVRFKENALQGWR